MSPAGSRLGGGLAVVLLIVSGTLLAVSAGLLLVSALSLLGNGESVEAFAGPALLYALGGALGLRIAAARNWSGVVLRPEIGFLAVITAWTAAAVAGAVPFLLAGTFDSPVDAFFESMSGFTTGGATVLPSYDQPDAVFWWRSVTEWLGGIGIVVLVVAIAPVTGIGLQRVFYAEVSQVTSDRLTPRIIDTAKIIGGIYLTISGLLLLAYLAAGMNAFDAANHTMTTTSTGGFSTEPTSIAAFDSVPIELVTIGGMILAGINFAFYWRVIRGRDLMPQLAEVRTYIVLLALASVVLVVSVLIAGDVPELIEAIRYGGFSAVSMMTGTGFVTADWDTWNGFARTFILGLMFVGACAGSTTGGIKVIRLMMLAKTARQELDRQLQPSAVQVLRVGGRTFSEDVRRAVLGFFLLFVGVFAAGSVAIAATGVDPITAISASAATVNIVGTGLGEIGATDDFSAIPEAGRLVAAFLMLTGRLEVFTVVALLAAVFKLHRRG
jgi:trk system potassium uptake protein TrkH